MNSYITLDGKRYKTPAKTWNPTVNKPATVRSTLAGAIDATFGPATFQEWQGQIEAAVTPATNYGSVSDIRTTLAKRQSVTFIDHYGTSHTVVCLGPHKEESLSSMWDGASNVIYFNVRIVKVS